VLFVNPDTGWAVGWNDLILKTTNGGTNWTLQASAIGAFVSYLNSVCFINENTGWAVSGYMRGNIQKTTNGGVNWFFQIDYLSSGLNSVWFNDENTGWTVGDNGVILKTTNGGSNWINQINLFPSYLYSVQFINNNTGWAVSGYSYSVLQKTTNGGTNWIYEFNPSGVNIFLKSVFFIDENTGWTVGSGGTILKTTNGGSMITGIQSVSSELPSEYNLSQNFPNPFNPTTHLKFGIITPGLVTLKVYNLLGNEIETLVNKNLTPGVYDVDFDGSNFPSGIYFYKLETGFFSETKRMILLK
jgi:photosystem II stability/assembly factor-like uncharacterized protein